MYTIEENKHFVVIIPGLGDNVLLTKIGTNHWVRSGVIPIIHSVGWHDNENIFEPKLKRVLELIDKLKMNNNKVSLVGCSAGGSAVLNAYSERKDQIHKIINVCGRLRPGSLTGLRSFKAKTASSPAFAQSILLSEKNQTFFNTEDLNKFMTISAKFGDQLVPKDTSILEGATNLEVPTGEHLISIAAALTVYSKNLINFLKN